ENGMIARIASNRAGMDQAFGNKRASCLVNPRAFRGTELWYVKKPRKVRVAVVGGGPAGLSCATVAAECGHDVTLFEASDTLGGQLRMAAEVPGKEEFRETLRYYTRQLEKGGVDVRLGVKAEAQALKDEGFERVV